MFHETDSSHPNLSRVIDCFRGEVHHSREAGPPEQPQREARRPPAQSRSLAAPKIIVRPSRTKSFIPLRPPNRTSTDQVTISLTSSIDVSPSLLPAWGFGAAPSHPRNLKSDSPSIVAGSNRQPLATAPPGGRGPSFASLFALACSLTLVRYSIASTSYAIPRQDLK